MEVNTTRTPWAAAPSLPIPGAAPHKKNPHGPPKSDTDTRGPPHPRRHLGTDAGEDPIIRSCETTVAHAHKKPSFHSATKPTKTHLMIAYRLIGHVATTPACACVHTNRAVVAAGWAEGNCSLTPVRGPSAHLFTITCLSCSVHAYKPDRQGSAWCRRDNSQCQFCGASVGHISHAHRPLAESLFEVGP